MGLCLSAFKYLLRENQQRPFKGSILQLGRQDVYFTHQQAQRAANELGLNLPQIQITLSSKPEYAAQSFLSDTSTFQLLGFQECQATDKSGFESADFLFDLNEPSVPHELRGRFDVLLDGGTIEHVFHVPNALANVYHFLREGGRIIHMSPSSNYVDHGFYMFSPTLFHDYYQTNNFEINALHFFRHSPQRINKTPWELIDYTPGCLRRVAFGGLDASCYGTICVATKTQLSTINKNPQQTRYVNVWEGSAPTAERRSKKRPWYRPVKMAYDYTRKIIRSPLGWLVHLARIRPLKELGLKVDSRL